jgi:hypothetical protein
VTLQNRPGCFAPDQKRFQNEKTANSGKSLNTAPVPGAPGINASAEAFLHNQGQKPTFVTNNFACKNRRILKGEPHG